MPSIWLLNDTYPACLYQRASSRLFSETAPSFVPLGIPYYGGSVALGLASRRQSRLCSHETFSTCRCPFRFLAPLVTGYSPQRAFASHADLLAIFSHTRQTMCHCGVVASGMLRRVLISPLETGVQPIQVSPCVQDLRCVALHTFALNRCRVRGQVLVVQEHQPLPAEPCWHLSAHTALQGCGSSSQV